VGQTGLARRDMLRTMTESPPAAPFTRTAKARRPFAQGETASFGERDVPAAAKSGLVRGVFDSVARRYDLMNDLMSAGVHRIWKDRLANWVAPRAGETILDVAGGTGDIAQRLLKRSDGGAHVVLCDLTESMLRVGRDRAIDRGVCDGLAWVCGDAQALPVASRSVDAVTIAFGLRNVTHIEAALAEARRVLRPGGRFACLEFSQVAIPGLDAAYETYSDAVLPRLGALVAGDRESYRYLVESIRRFPDQETLASLLHATGFAKVGYRNYSGGIAALHTGWRL